MSATRVTQAVLMAAGLGTRMRPFTDACPKPLLPFFGVEVAQFAIDRLAEAGVRRIVVNVHHLPERTRAGFLGLDWPRGMELIFSDERAQLLGSGGGLKQMLAHLDQTRPFFWLNGDVLVDVDLEALGAAYARLSRESAIRLVLGVRPQGPAGGKYREIVTDGRASGRVLELGELREGRPYFASAAVLAAAALAGIPAGAPYEFAPDYLRGLVARRAVGYFTFAGRWYDFGDPELWWRAHLEVARALELGQLPRDWRLRIESRARRVADGRWEGRAFCLDAAHRSVVYGAPDALNEAGIALDAITWRARA